MAYTYNITIPLKVQLVSTKDKLVQSREVNFVVDFITQTPITQGEVEQAELFLQGKPVTSDTELMRCVKSIADSFLTESKPMLARLSALRPNIPQVKTEVVLNGNIGWNEKRAATA
jgi:hypothetical protein